MYFFYGLTCKRMADIQKLSKQISFSELVYYFKGNSGANNSIGLKGPLGLFNNIKDGCINIKKTEENQKEIKLDLNEITKRKWEHKSEEQKSVID